MQELGKYKDEKMKVIANTLEKYVSFSVGELRFIDSFQFMSTSLEKLVTNLSAEGKEKFKNVTAEFPNIKHQDLLLRKDCIRTTMWIILPSLLNSTTS